MKGVFVELILKTAFWGFGLWLYWPVWTIGWCVRLGWWCDQAYHP